ncbi:helix-turn-helix domain-containing protein [Virgibacillus pantothenticus]|uniref:helix-turn-helix domain-containing protein n=1 Tax=Virgibacillus pantothenticus TaxID=1473 RepID=UPI00147C3E08|nr:helix-turn-helix transcriptional regulator [Virgibacillus pantothenticus]
MNIGEKIKFFRKQAKLTQKGLAVKSNLSRSYIADLERNRYNPSVETLQVIAYALNITTNDLLKENKTIDNDAQVLYRAITKMSPVQRKKAIKILKAIELI